MVLMNMKQKFNERKESISGNTVKPRFGVLLYFLWLVIVLTVVFITPATLINLSDYQSVGLYKNVLNVLCIFIIWGAAFVVTAKPVLCVVVGTFFMMTFATVNSFIYQFRGKELGFTDIFSIKTAISVSGQYSVNISDNLIYIWTLFVIITVLGIMIPKLPKLPKNRTRLIALSAESLLIIALIFLSDGISIKTWDNEGTRFNGYYLNFYLGIRDSIIKKPQNYSPENIQKISQEYIAFDVAEEYSRPNVIVIMEESFADLSILGDIKTTQQVTPYFDSLTENTIRGYALTSAYGGNTANVEFEFLTGDSMAFLPENSVPYQQYIKGDTHSFADVMKSYGYSCVATHPYYANGWSRNIIYPYFGFSEASFIEEYSRNYPVRDYVSDMDMFEYVINQLDDKNSDKPIFLFGITMQNHGGYDYIGENLENSIELTGYSREFAETNQYLSLMHETDVAVKYLFETLENFSENTIVLIFGDHFPKLETEFYEELYGGTFDTLNDQMCQHKIPFIIWANYDIPEERIECISVNYLSGHLLKAAGLPLSPYHKFLSDVEQIIPAMNAFGYYSISQNDYVDYDEAEGVEAEWINKYASLVYNHLFDKKNRSEVFFWIDDRLEFS